MGFKRGIICLAAILFVGGLARAVMAQVKTEKSRTAQTQAVSVAGRYQIIINPSVRADTFLLDTQTGRIWRPTVYTNLEGSPEVWAPVDRADNEVELYEWASHHPMKEKQSTPSKP